MVISPEPVWKEFTDKFEQEYQNAVVYGDFDQEIILHEGTLSILANGWIELPSGRLLSPEAVHHIDT